MRTITLLAVLGCTAMIGAIPIEDGALAGGIARRQAYVPLQSSYTGSMDVLTQLKKHDLSLAITADWMPVILLTAISSLKIMVVNSSVIRSRIGYLPGSALRLIKFSATTVNQPSLLTLLYR
jgi:hypothetical protein